MGSEAEETVMARAMDGWGPMSPGTKGSTADLWAPNIYQALMLSLSQTHATKGCNFDCPSHLAFKELDELGARMAELETRVRSYSKWSRQTAVPDWAVVPGWDQQHSG